MSVFALAALVGSIGVTYAKANEDPHYDKFSLNYTTGDPVAYSGTADKDNASYAYCQAFGDNPYGFSASVIGANSDDSLVTSITAPAYYLAPGQASYMVNFVHENGLPKAAIRGESTVDVIYEVWAAWQADTGVY